MDATIDPEGKRLPIKLDTASNGEFVPVPLSKANRAAKVLAHESASANAKNLNLTRRSFLVSACGAASTLLAFNRAHGTTGGFFEIEPEAALDLQLAQATLGDRRGGKGEFVFDVQGHFVDPTGAWVKNAPADAFKWSPKASCALGREGGRSYLNCLGPDEFVKDVFLDSDTDMMVLSFVPSTRESEPVTIQAADAVRRIVERLQGTHRLLLHGRVNPNQKGDLEAMDELKERWGVSAWKTYTQFGPGGRGYFLSDDPGVRFIEKARALGVKVICVHKGLPFGRRSYEHSQCSDIGVVAKRFPDVDFLVYHSGFVTSVTEGPYGKNDGIDTLIRSLIENDVKPNGNVYAELGSTWRFLMRDPEQAAHALGKLIKNCGEDNVLWGTDSIWYGSPQDQIVAFRAFQISREFRERFGYPEITPALRAKIFGLNGAKVYGLSASEVRKHTRADDVARERTAYLDHPEPRYLTYGPKTRREFLALRSKTATAL